MAGPTDPPHAQGNATVETDFTEGDAPARLTEDLLGELATGLAILGPSRRPDRAGTDIQAESVYNALALQAKPVRAWIARGFNPTGAHKCWHITSSEISEHSFPKLGSFFASTTASGPYAHAVAFHGHNDSEAIVVGGGLPRNDEHTALKTELSSKIRIALEAVVDPTPVVEVGCSDPWRAHNVRTSSTGLRSGGTAYRSNNRPRSGQTKRNAKRSPVPSRSSTAISSRAGQHNLLTGVSG